MRRERGREGVVQAMKDRRTSDRDMCSDLVEIAFQDQFGEPVLETGLLEDLSEDGLCISLGIPLSEGTPIEFDCDGFSGEAHVRYCNIGDYGYIVGVEFAAGLRWDREAWSPKHLLPASSSESSSAPES
jgi:hypothetical protein